MAEAKRTTLQVPVLLGQNYEHVMARADIVEEGDEMTITIKAKGREFVNMQNVVAQIDILAVSFVGIPVKPHTPKKETT